MGCPRPQTYKFRYTLFRETCEGAVDFVFPRRHKPIAGNGVLPSDARGALFGIALAV